MFKNYGSTFLLFPGVVVVAMFILSSCATPPSQQGFAVNLFMLRDVFFDFNKTSINDDAKAVLKRNARILKDYPSQKIIVEGYADIKGSNAYNLSLSRRRANATKKYLVRLGIDSSRMKTVGKGETTQFNKGWTFHFRKIQDPGLNRRAHFQPG
ncbi:MAG: OmpA family protein [Candidatus Dadabacteria bacterium]|nr:OmpA family protein [Candidatus Dadabacteria bacterium]